LRLIAWTALCAAAQQGGAPREAVEAEFTIDHADSRRASSTGMQAGEDAIVRFRVRDKVSATPLEGRHPAAWLDPMSPDEAQRPISCKDRLKSLLSSDILSRPAIDLNTYYVLVMNNDASITVMEPQFGSGDARALAAISLKAPAADWTFSADGKLLFVSMPQAGRVAVIDTGKWQLQRDIEIGPDAGRLALQPDGHYLWVAYDSGLAAVDAADLTLAGRVATGAGPHEIAFDTSNQVAFATNREAGTVTLIDIGRLAVSATLRTGHRPASIAFSSKSQMAYVTDEQDGSISAIDAGHGSVGTIAAKISSEPGLGTIRFARDGRFAIVLNPDRKQVHVLDASVNRLVQTGATAAHPDQVTFSSTIAYVRQRDSDSVLMIPLEGIGVENKPLPVADFPAGQHPLGQFSAAAYGDSIVQTPGENAVIAANPADRAVYYYMEGMAAPIGFFSTRTREPRAVLVFDHGLKETSKGVYQTTVHLTRPGMYTVAFLMDSPQALKCWDLAVEPDPNAPRVSTVPVEVESLIDEKAIRPGAPLTLSFRIREVATKSPKSGAKDVSVQIFRAPGVWHQRKTIEPAGNDGSYSAVFLLPEPGLYYVNVESPSLGLNLSSEPVILRVSGQ
jgi:6-phosphogluconolactonase (cycloisomerase 2 family)